MTDGNCKGADTDIFYDRTRWSEAAKFCDGCPILMDCRNRFAEDPWAYAGGMRPHERAIWVLGDARKGRAGRRIVTPEKIKEILEIFDGELIGSGKLAERVDLSKSTVQRILRAHGRQRTRQEQLELSRLGGAATKTARKDGEYTRAMVKKMSEEGYTPAQMARILGKSQSYVYAIQSQQRRGLIP